MGYFFKTWTHIIMFLLRNLLISLQERTWDSQIILTLQTVETNQSVRSPLDLNTVKRLITANTTVFNEMSMNPRKSFVFVGFSCIEQVIMEMTNGGADFCFECLGLDSVMKAAFASSRQVSSSQYIADERASNFSFGVKDERTS